MVKEGGLYWISATGARTRIANMDSAHLDNVSKMVHEHLKVARVRVEMARDGAGTEELQAAEFQLVQKLAEVAAFDSLLSDVEASKADEQIVIKEYNKPERQSFRFADILYFDVVRKGPGRRLLVLTMPNKIVKLLVSRWTAERFEGVMGVR